MARAETVVAWEVHDSGIGIAPENLAKIFDAFQQADSGIDRRFGGTGLGLAISREIALLLGGDLGVVSTYGEGSIFTLYLPEHPSSSDSNTTPLRLSRSEILSAVDLEDDRALLLNEESEGEAQEERRAVLMIEDDEKFGAILLEMARERGFAGVVTGDGREAIALARRFDPVAITLDLRLPNTSGWAVLDQLKHDPQLAPIPVHVISVEDAGQRGRVAGALTVLTKPVDAEQLQGAFDSMQAFVDRPLQRLLIVEDDEAMRSALSELLDGDDVELEVVPDAEQALAEVGERGYDCAVIDLGLPGLGGLELLEQLRERAPQLPIVVYTGRELGEDEQVSLRELADALVLKDASGPGRLLAQTSLYLHRPQDSLSQEHLELLRNEGDDASLAGRRILLVDDDVRNIYALTSALEPSGLDVLFAENGREALELLDEEQGVELIVMDVMMPEMDGLEATRRIRRDPRFAELPILTLTAKAMAGDREACLEAGASDYVTKPVDAAHLLSLIRVYLNR